MALNINQIKATIAEYVRKKSSLEGQKQQLEKQKLEIEEEFKKEKVAINEVDTILASLEEDINKEVKIIEEINSNI